MKKLFIFLICILLITACSYGYYYIQSKKPIENIGNNTIKQEENSTNELEQFLFTDNKLKLVYEGGPVHWGSRTVVCGDIENIDGIKTVSLNVTDESDLKGEEPKKQWVEKWEIKSNGMYVDNILMLKTPLKLDDEWTVENYSPIVKKDQKYIAKIKIMNITDSVNDKNEKIKQVTIKLTIDGIKTVDNNSYTETIIFETSVGIKEKTVTSPDISNLELKYWIERKDAI